MEAAKPLEDAAVPVVIGERAPDEALGIVEDEPQALGRSVADDLENEFTASDDFHQNCLSGSGSGIAFRLSLNASSRHLGATSSVGVESISTPD